MTVIRFFLIACFIHVQLRFVLTLEPKLTRKQENLLYSHLKNQTHLKLFYNQLIESNGVEDPMYMREKATDEDIRQGTIENKCFESADNLMDSLNILRTNEDANLTRENVMQLIPALISIKFSEGCLKLLGSTKWKNILVGLLAVFIINLASLFSAIILPFRKKPAFKWLLTTFIGLAVGTLVGTGIFHLIPMAFDVEKYDKSSSFLSKGLAGIIVIYLFYMRDHLLASLVKVGQIAPAHDHGDEDVTLILQQKNTKSLKENLTAMKPIGWMILISDLLHGFIDGITIGAISIVSIGECLRMMVPIVCEEFSHKLGDAAVLLSSGLPVKQALLMNFLSSCGCYPGFILGAKLGEMENFHPWICGIAGGMFIYIGLTDMVPELISMGHEIEKDHAIARKPITPLIKTKIILCQHIGVIFGMAIMFVLAKYGEMLSQHF